ncbi:MAG: hypothetical protein IIC39_07185 [Candidatus Marinimicrobia bacterium]|nr:hypothetical protein [Candidatus Neomarinimicrobiota bacterium]
MEAYYIGSISYSSQMPCVARPLISSSSTVAASVSSARIGGKCYSAHHRSGSSVHPAVVEEGSRRCERARKAAAGLNTTVEGAVRVTRSAARYTVVNVSLPTPFDSRPDRDGFPNWVITVVLHQDDI